MTFEKTKVLNNGFLGAVIFGVGLADLKMEVLQRPFSIFKQKNMFQQKILLTKSSSFEVRKQ